MIRLPRQVAAALVGAILFAAVSLGQTAWAQSAAPRFDLPVACTVGEDCHMQFYIDVDPSPAARDYRCGRLSYDGHKGVDFRTPDLVAMERGVPVIAAAAGFVRAIREGEPDISVTERTPESVGERMAGNAVVLRHGEGWETQYSHLKNGSITVKPGEQVAAGQVLGQIGLSGNTNFPHLDFSVRRDGQVVDPFTGRGMNEGCGLEGTSLWSVRARAVLDYRPSGVLIAGFANGVPTKATVRAGAHRADTFTTDEAALVFWTDVFGIQSGDVEEFRIVAPNGKVLVNHRSTLEKDAHQHFMFAGRKRPKGGWPAGTYQAEYRLLRGADNVVLSVTRTATLR